MRWSRLSWIVRALFLILLSAGSRALDCFKCASTAGSYVPCEDPFHNNVTQDILESPCWAGRKDRDGVFPATSCVKMAGIYEDTGERLVVRGCALDSGTLTIDTELVRMSNCGAFYYDGRYVRGCVQNCFENGCNAAAALGPGSAPLLLAALVGALRSLSLSTALHTFGKRVEPLLREIPDFLKSL